MIAVLFPGQGSQAVGMLDGFDSAELRQTLEEASEALGWDVGGLIAQGPESRLNQTENTQPAILAASIALWRHARAHHGLAADLLAGHSLGEYSALVAAEALDLGTALKLVAARGRFMQQYAPAGAGMAAVIGLDDAAVEAVCADSPEGRLYPVNYNSPGQVVVAGEAAALDWLEAAARAAGARMVTRLAMSVPSHCPMLEAAAEALAPMLEAASFHSAKVPVLHNIDAAPRTDAAGIRQALRRQLCEPVRWTQTQLALQTAGATALVECGPGKVLTGLARRSLRGVPCTPIGSAETMAQLDAILDSHHRGSQAAPHSHQEQ